MPNMDASSEFKTMAGNLQHISNSYQTKRTMKYAIIENEEISRLNLLNIIKNSEAKIRDLNGGNE